MTSTTATIATEDRTPESSRRVARVELTLVAFPMQDVGKCPISGEVIDQPGATTERRRLAVRILTADGAEGVYLGGNETMWQQAVTTARMLVGRDALAREALYQDVKRKLRKSDRMGVGPIDIALWDLAGKRLGASVSQLLGGYRDRVPAYASTWFGSSEGGLSSPEAYADFALHCQELGYRAFKMHGWTKGDVAPEVATVRLLGRTVGETMKLMHDSACYLRTFADAVELGRACDEAAFFWLEDPFSDGGLSAYAHKKLRSMIKTPILLGEHVRGLESMAGLLLADGTDLIRADPDFDMGITGTMKIAHLAEALGIDVELHAPGPAHRHCMAAIRNTNFYELSLVGPNGHGFTGPDLYTCGYSDRLEDVGRDGCFPVPEGAGLGVTYNWKRLESIAKEHLVLK